MNFSHYIQSHIIYKMYLFIITYVSLQITVAKEVVCLNTSKPVKMQTRVCSTKSKGLLKAMEPSQETQVSQCSQSWPHSLEGIDRGKSSVMVSKGIRLWALLIVGVRGRSG